jgi:6-pyruvoyltetrahydropterin/6-carboxytetrahydropterin synthase
MLTVTKKFSFEAAHRLPEYDGKCANFHGHRWELEVEVEGPAVKIVHNKKSYRGILLDFGDLKKIINEYIVNYFDHSYINNFCSHDEENKLYRDRMSTCDNISGEIVGKVEPHIFGNPTCENIVAWIQRVLFTIFVKNLVRIRLYETKDSYVEWRRDENK